MSKHPRTGKIDVGHEEPCLKHCICTHCAQPQCEMACAICVDQGHPCPCAQCSEHVDE